MLYKTDKESFKFQKPDNWSSLELYKKIGYYKTILNENYSPYIDKLAAKKIVKDFCGDKIKVTKTVRILKGPSDLFPTDLNPNHMIKTAHGSGWNINITPSTKLAESRLLLSNWNQPYLLHNESQYKYIKPRFFIEEKVDDKFHGKNGEADVYTFRCIHGIPVTINVKRFGKFNKYDTNFRLLESPAFDLEKPVELDRMLELSRILSSPFEFIRVDFYLDKESNIYFSEFTFTPNAGYQFYTNDIEVSLGALWK